MEIMDCILRPCCELRNDSPELKKRLKVIVTPYDVIYQSMKVGQLSYAPIVGDSVFDYTVWAVDYHRHIAYVTD